jgi:hypothetical protein
LTFPLKINSNKCLILHPAQFEKRGLAAQMSQRGWKLRRTRRILVACALLLLLGGRTSTALAQDFAGLIDYCSPLFSLPSLQGEARVTPIWIGISGGNQVIPSQGITWNLRDQFGLTQTNLFVDSMVRLQLGRFSLRVEYDPRDFAATKPAVNNPFVEATARLSYSGARLGGDLDIVQYYRSRVGVDLDYDIFSPVFSETIETTGGKRIIGNSALTMGAHLVFMPATNLYGVSPLFEARCRWPVSGAQVTDLEIAGGLRGPESILGAVALKGGYRHTKLGFTSSQLYNGLAVSTTFDATMSGGFVEFAYYY